MLKETLVVEKLEKYFPPTLSGWRTLLHPFSPPTLPALGGISFRVRAGEVLAVIGTNGAGKSTLLRILTTLLLPTRGRAEVAGYDVVHESGNVRKQIGYLTGSEPGFYPRLSAAENLRLFGALNNLPRRAVALGIARMADLLGLGDVLDRQVRTLSTGTVHRLGLARALLHMPSVLLLDEPTRSLDPLAASEFRRFVKDELVRQRGTTLVFASHTLAEVEQLADRVALLDGGRLRACDTPKELLATAGAGSLEEVLQKLTDADHRPRT